VVLDGTSSLALGSLLAVNRLAPDYSLEPAHASLDLRWGHMGPPFVDLSPFLLQLNQFVLVLVGKPEISIYEAASSQD